MGAGQTPGESIGNGRATAIAFAREGARLLLADRDADSLAATADLVREENAEVHSIVIDVTNDDAAEQVVTLAQHHLGRVDVLHNNVGIGEGDSSPQRLTDDAYDRIMNVNLRSTWRMCRSIVPVMRTGGGGAIVNVSSLASIAAAGMLTAYKISKAGINALTQNLATTNARFGIRANAILPGFIDTPMAVDAPARAAGRTREEYAAGRASIVPLGRQGTAWDVAAAAVFLASDEASFITGVLLPVDGGQSARVG